MRILLFVYLVVGTAINGTGRLVIGKPTGLIRKRIIAQHVAPLNKAFLAGGGGGGGLEGGRKAGEVCRVAIHPAKYIVYLCRSLPNGRKYRLYL